MTNPERREVPDSMTLELAKEVRSLGSSFDKYERNRERVAALSATFETKAWGIARILAQGFIKGHESRDAEVAAFARDIIRRQKDNPVCDHACGGCVPGGDIIVPGFLCAYHEASKLIEGGK